MSPPLDTLRGTPQAITAAALGFAVLVTCAGSLHAQEPAPATVIAMDEFALHLPPTAAPIRGVIVLLGGPDTRAFVTGTGFGAPSPVLEVSLQHLGGELRRIASDAGVAIFGTSRAMLPDGVESDGLLRDALVRAGSVSGHAELASVPILLFGISGGAPEATGFAVRHPDRILGLSLKVPVAAAALESVEARHIPTLFLLAEQDALVENADILAIFDANLGADTPWALAIEPGVPHHALTPAARALFLSWISGVLELRFAHPDGLELSAGWRGEPRTHQLSPWQGTVMDRAGASWLPSEAAARAWAWLLAPQPAGGDPPR